MDRLRDKGLDTAGLAIFENVSLARASSLGIGGCVDWWIEPDSVEQLARVISFFKHRGWPYRVLGRATNVLCPDQGIPAIICLRRGSFCCMTRREGRVSCGAGVTLAQLISYCIEHSLGGPERLIGIPGSVGGAVMMNAGYAAAIGDMLLDVGLLGADGTLVRRSAQELSFGYRTSHLEGEIVLDAGFRVEWQAHRGLQKTARELMRHKMLTQPLHERSAGCVFKNPAHAQHAAAWYIEKCGLKGSRIGDAALSEKHANFLVNRGQATYRDARELIRNAQEKVRDSFGIALETELCFL